MSQGADPELDEVLGLYRDAEGRMRELAESRQNLRLLNVADATAALHRLADPAAADGEGPDAWGVARLAELYRAVG